MGNRNRAIYVNGVELNRSSQAYRTLRREFKARCKARNTPCGICNGELGDILYDAEPGASRAFELDHIIPTAERPDLFLSSGNCRASHLACNRSRQAKELRESKPSPTGKWVRPSW